ncbi:hypothetical protein Pint_30430 [Pistacia integerrima]|uniref:Uncharacterized protein n=1 Tax=Pistacia integerrima TaxID=434235 RepID=A0ACC0X184_9ROSI|nr:hypothetical protein Pint_30430 [Pistacia integerrima]
MNWVVGRRSSRGIVSS